MHGKSCISAKPKAIILALINVVTRNASTTSDNSGLISQPGLYCSSSGGCGCNLKSSHCNYCNIELSILQMGRKKGPLPRRWGGGVVIFISHIGSTALMSHFCMKFFVLHWKIMPFLVEKIYNNIPSTVDSHNNTDVTR